MNADDLLILIPVASGFVSAFCLLMCITMAFKLRSLKKRAASLTSDFEDELAVLKQNLEASTSRAAEQARRVAWLESRVRPNTGGPRASEVEMPATNAVPSITERRHRILSLARRGLDASTIAAMLGELPGEVELIIGMSRAA
jgi:hypothetical protein